MTLTKDAPLMTTTRKSSALDRFLANPVLTAELHHQWYILEKSRSGRGWIAIAVLMLVPAILASLVYFIGGVIGWSDIPTIPQLDRGLLHQVFTIGLLLMITMNVALYVVVILITLGLSAASITREKTGKTWESLLLTNIDSRRIVLGKWWASMLALWGDHLMIGLLRLGMVAWVIVAFAQNRGLPDAPFGLSIGLGYVLPLVIIASLYTFLDATFTAAIGVAIPLSEWSGTVVAAVVLAVRLTATAAAVWWFWGLIGLIRTYGGVAYLPFALAGLGVCVFVTIAMLRLAMFMAVRAQVSPPDTTQSLPQSLN